MNQEVQITDDGIAAFDGFFSYQICQDYIKYFDQRLDAGLTNDRWTSKSKPSLIMEDSFIVLQDIQLVTTLEIKNASENFLNIFWNQCYPLYRKKFSVLEGFGRHQIYNVHIQKTLPTQGYHVWHCEAARKETCHRLMAFILYLNDVEEGGETEFLHLRKRIKPKEGKLILWPSGYVHTHRGNPPLSGTKYILTGWVEF